MGLDAPTPARTVGLPPRGGSTFFRSERKYQRKHAARRLQRRPAPLRVAGFGLREPFGLSSASVRFAHPPGKRLLLPILTAGLALSRAMKLASLPIRAERARARLFPPTKWAGLFPSAAYRRSAPPPLGWGRKSNSAGWDISARGGRFCKKGFQIMLACGASRRACCPTAVCIRQQTGNHTRPASREACRRAAALGTKAAETRGPLPSVSKAPYLSIQPPRPKARSGVQGHCPCRAAVTSQPSCMSF